MRRLLFQLGPLPIYTFGLMLAIGIVVATYIIYREARRKGLDSNYILDFVFWALIVGLLGARIGYIIFANPVYYLQNPLAFFRIQDGGLSIHGAIVGGIITGFFFARKKRISFWRLADTVAPGLALGIAIGRVGCDVFGKPMSGTWFWGVPLNGQLLHPVQVYEFLFDYLLFFYLWRRRARIKYDGQLFLQFMGLYATVRGLVEFFRYNPTVIGPLSVAHMASLAFIFMALVLAFILRRRSNLFQGSKELTTAIKLPPSSLALEVFSLLLVIYVSLLLFYGLGPV